MWRQNTDSMTCLLEVTSLSDEEIWAVSKTRVKVVAGDDWDEDDDDYEDDEEEDEDDYFPDDEDEDDFDDEDEDDVDDDGE